MRFNPKVSIVIPVYNGSNYMREAIDSALAQTYKNIEVIVINDGSDDNGATRKIAHSYGDRIRYFEKKNGGVSTALNLGIRVMKGDYFSWLSHDDVYLPDKVKYQLEYLSEIDEKICVLSSDFCFIDSESKHLYDYKYRLTDPEKLNYNMIVEGVHGCTLLIPKLCFDKIGSFNEELKTTQDYDLWFKIGGKYRFEHISEVLIKSRIHSEQNTLKYNKTCIYEQNNLYINVLHKMYQTDDMRVNKKIYIADYYDFSDVFFKRRLNRAYIYSIFCIYRINIINKTIFSLVKAHLLIIKHFFKLLFFILYSKIY